MPEMPKSLYELCEHRYKTDPEYRKVVEFFQQRCETIHMIKEFAIKHRGWPEKEAGQLATDIVCSGKTIKEFVGNQNG